MRGRAIPHVGRCSAQVWLQRSGGDEALSLTVLEGRGHLERVGVGAGERLEPTATLVTPFQWMSFFGRNVSWPSREDVGMNVGLSRKRRGMRPESGWSLA